MDYTNNKREGLKQLLKIIWSIIRPQQEKLNYITASIPKGFESKKPELVPIDETRCYILIKCFKNDIPKDN